jgi:hypothetical protein
VYTYHPLITFVITSILIACIYLPIQEVYYDEWFPAEETETILGKYLRENDTTYDVDSLQVTVDSLKVDIIDTIKTE